MSPIKVALPGPYLLARTMWMECISDQAYSSREDISADIVRVLREEIAELMDAGAALVQLDGPVLSEVVFSGAKNKRSFMCGAVGVASPTWPIRPRFSGFSRRKGLILLGAAERNGLW